MKPSIIKAGICSAVTAAVVVTVSGLVPVTALADPASPEMANRLVGKTIFLDPGHQGPNHTEELSRQVSNGRGGLKDCQTTGMTSMNGVPEHTINWNVAQLIKTSLESLGARVVLSRQDDTGWGGCIDDRARAANESGAAVAVSIHADSAPPQARGFHLIVPQLPIPNAVADQAQSGAGLAATKSVRDAYLQAGIPSANYAGVQDGLQTRADVAGPALTTVPNVFVEMGNGANAEDAALLETPDGQLKHALAITTGLVSYLLGSTPAAAPGSTGSATDRPAAAPAETVPAQNVPAPNVPQAAPNGSVPQYQAAPGTPGSRTAPGTTPGIEMAPSTPGSQTAPGSQSTPSTGIGGLVGTVIQLLLPLARTLGMDNSVVTSELINLAYTLASALLGPSK
ncbi:N-acetylmuramoyl-L-alanine amidase [Nocardia sp. NPDC050710]|uniref:N-acetylmuramoyl-L-alanine amidase n=1 Tax=Nocardia sp. NPDC050710 TaxID=3157220 RepID=UPI0033EF9D1B